MDNSNIRNLKLISYGIMAYMVLAFSWWSVLLYTKNKDAFTAKKEQMILVNLQEGNIQNRAEVELLPQYKKMAGDYKKQEYMIIGEAFVFLVILFIGLRLIINGYNKQIRATAQSRNFLLSITHELKSPIASIRLTLETIKKRVLREDQKEKLIGNGLRESDRLLQLVNDLLLSARLESAYQPHLEALNLVGLIQESIQIVKNKRKNLSISFDHPPDMPHFMGDKTGLTSVLLNLIENAVKYSASSAEIKISLIHAGQNLFLNIADQGIGIDDREKKKVFEKFYRVGSEDTRRTKGTGLGLYIVKQIIEAHEGSIRIADNTPKGSIFKISFPIRNVNNSESLLLPQEA